MSVINIRTNIEVFHGTLEQCRLIMRNMSSRLIARYLVIRDSQGVTMA